MQQNRIDITQTANGVSAPFGINNGDAVGLTVAWNASVTAGVITLETAHEGDYTGTWATQMTLTYAAGAPMVMTEAAQMTGVVGRIRLASIAGSGASVTTTVIVSSYN